ncbi:unnamed protein product [Nezara viridula]|uniref:Uncharacterized protein n=1 Tax=Nezara viridula TaxID=85310 RepID=A0A9P0MQ28_NEZVI|nr:unnamed protein product [Nezara viridula]
MKIRAEQTSFEGINCAGGSHGVSCRSSHGLSPSKGEPGLLRLSQALLGGPGVLQEERETDCMLLASLRLPFLSTPPSDPSIYFVLFLFSPPILLGLPSFRLHLPIPRPTPSSSPLGPPYPGVRRQSPDPETVATPCREWSPGGSGGGTQQQLSVVTTVWGVTTSTQSEAAFGGAKSSPVAQPPPPHYTTPPNYRHSSPG